MTAPSPTRGLGGALACATALASHHGHAAAPGSTPLGPPSHGAEAAPLFEALDPAQTGFRFVSELRADHPTAYLYRSGFACGGVAAGDVDGDGWPDLFCVGGAGANTLFRQVPPGAGAAAGLRFEDITAASPGLDGGAHWGAGCSFADLDLDGDLDLFVCRYDAPNGVFLNDGKGRFTPAPAGTGLDITDACHTPAFADYDGDGDLDLYLATNRYEDPQGYRGEQAITIGDDGRPAVRRGFEKYYATWFEDFDNWGINAYGREDYLLRNDGPGADGAPRFTDVTEEAGISRRGDALSAHWWDYDLDGDPDLYVANDFISADRLYQNNGDGTFTDVIADAVPHTSWFSMGADFGDLDGDGLPEFLVADMSATNHFKQKTTMGVMGGDILRRANSSAPPQYMRNALYLNAGGGRFLEGAFLSEIESSDWTWTVMLADFDLDGANDLFFTNGTPRAMNDSDLTLSKEQLAAKHEWEYVKGFPRRDEKNRAFRNLGGLHFEDASDAWGLGLVGVSYSAAHADFDRDGDLDLVVLNVEGEASLYQNHAGAENRIAIELRGSESDRRGAGALVELRAGGRTLTWQAQADRGFLGCSDLVACFGLGAAASADELVVRWPSGAVSRHSALAAGRRYLVSEADAAGPAPSPPEPEPLFEGLASLDLRAHDDPPYDDFAHQSLLPNSLSALGPAAAWGDLDGDGDDDLFLGGGAGQPGALYRNDGGKLAPLPCAALAADAAAEDMGAVFLDADSDGDLDLFVASGSYEFPPGDPLLRDRLYLNDGAGALAAAPAGAVPDTAASSSGACAADLDGDGDLDLFVGGRVTPRQYPVGPQSALLVNEGGAFRDATAALAPGLAGAGMVTAALWSDADGDGDPDLLVAREWGAPMLWRNSGGKLADASEDAGLSAHPGWWNSLAAADLDGDGDLDLAAGNQGLNTKYHASSSKPVELYFGDYHGDGNRCIVEAEWEGDTLFPVRGKSCSTRAMPQLADKFRTYRSFAAASLGEIYAPAKLDDALHFKVTELRSGIFLNDGSGRFEFAPLPHLAQISPAFGIAATDLDADGRTDLFLAQNFFGPQSETGRFDGGAGMVLLGEGGGRFAPLTLAESGVFLRGDMTSAATADLDGDARPDLLVARNAAAPALLANRGAGAPVAVRLRGPAGNPAAAGARVALRAGERVQVAEVHAGSGYLGTPAPVLFFARPDSPAATLEVRWPDGGTSTHPLPAAGETATLSR